MVSILFFLLHTFKYWFSPVPAFYTEFNWFEIFAKMLFEKIFNFLKVLFKTHELITQIKGLTDSLNPLNLKTLPSRDNTLTS